MEANKLTGDEKFNKECWELSKQIALKFLGDPYVGGQFLTDLPQPPYPAPPFPAPPGIIETAMHLREFSQLLFEIIYPIALAYIIYKIQRNDSRKSQREFQRELETKLREILIERQNQIDEYLEKDIKLHIEFKKLNMKKIFIRVKPDMKTKFELRLKIYEDTANILQNPERACEIMMKILNELDNEKSN